MVLSPAPSERVSITHIYIYIAVIKSFPQKRWFHIVSHRCQMTKFIIITDGVLTGLGKGVVTSSLGMLLKTHGFSVIAIKV